MLSKTPLFVLAITASAASAFVTPQQNAVVARPESSLSESFGFGFAEDTYENQPDLLKGEQAYKTYMYNVNDNSFVNRQYAILRRVRELNLLQKTVDAGVLSSLDEQGLDLETVEELLPLIDELGLLGIAGSNQQLLINLVGFLAIEGAPFIIPVLGGALKTGPIAFYGAAAATGGLEAALIATQAKIPFVGLPADFFLGLLLVPLTVLFAGLGVGLTNLNNNKSEVVA